MKMLSQTQACFTDTAIFTIFTSESLFFFLEIYCKVARFELSTRRLANRVCKSGYPLSGYPDLSVNFMAAKNPDILVANPDIRYPDLSINFMAAKNLILEF